MRKKLLFLLFTFTLFHYSLLASITTETTINAPTFAGGEPDLTERGLMTPTGWWWLTNVSPATIKDKIEEGYRLIDLEVESTSPYRFSAAFVKNTGEHHKGWWWYYGKTSAQIKDIIKEKKARIIDLQISFVNGQKRYTVVMISNTGANKKGWWYYSKLKFDQIATLLKENKARLIDLDTYVKDGKRFFSAVMIPNKGDDKKNWWYYSNISASDLKDALASHKARIVDIEVRHLVGNTPRFTVILEKTKGHTWWWYYGKTQTQVNELTNQNGARIIDITPYRLSNNKKRFAVLMLRNTNDLTNTMRKYLKTRRTGGSYGLYLKQVKGGVKASLQEAKSFYPASTIKVLEHAHTMREIQEGNTSLNTYIAKYPNGGESCQDSHVGHTVEWVKMQTILKTMMENSDNQSTNAVQEYFGNGNAAVGRAEINATASNLLKMSNASKLNHKLGCGGPTNDPANTLILKDLGKLYEKTARTFFNTNTIRDKFRSLMLNGKGALKTVAKEEATKLGLSNAIANEFIGDMETAAKAGSFTSGAKKYLSIGGWVKLPRKNANAREYVFGLFVDRANTIDLNIWDARGELLRQAIHDALKTYKSARSRNAISNNEASLNTTLQAVQLHQNAPNPFTGSTRISYAIPQNTESAELVIHNQLGQLMQRTPIAELGTGQVEVNAINYTPGIYMYSLLIDGKLLQTNRMVVQ